MEKRLSLSQRILFFVDASTYKLSNDKNSFRAKQPTFMGYFWWNIVYWPLHWLKIGHHISLYILLAIALVEIVLQIAYSDKIREIGDDIFNYYTKASYYTLAALVIGFTLWNVYYLFSNV
jgi:hypothetical protein